jgi:formate dehydrogenase iron-sulfur subunit
MTEKMSRKDFLKVAGASLMVAPLALEGLDRGERSPVQELGKQKGVVVDIRRCIGCKACQIACKAWNKLPAEKTEISEDGEYTNPTNLSAITWKVVHFKEVGEYDNEVEGTGGLKWRMMSDNCKHCLEPSCVSVCPSGALWKRSDGPVLYDVDRCIGCGYCTMACPWGVPHFDDEIHAIRKCTMCYDRIDQGLEPACVSVCPTDALKFMTLEEARKAVAEAEAAGLYTYGLDEVGGTSWLYISDIPFSEFGLPEYTSVTQKGYETDLLVKFAGAGLFVGGAMLAAIRLYAERRDSIAKKGGY